MLGEISYVIYFQKVEKIFMIAMLLLHTAQD